MEDDGDGMQGGRLVEVKDEKKDLKKVEEAGRSKSMSIDMD